ncbi:MAG TPA: anthranilate synthase component I [Paracoccaceae bacterium]|nr:anthranilate synthase component I [Paracoccaceae bacterium]
MDFRPDKAGFVAGYEAGENQLLSAELVADMDTAVSLMLKLTGAEADSFLLESVTGGEVRGRYSMLGCRPDLIWRCRGDRAEINRNAQTDRDAFQPDARPALESLRALLAESRIELGPHLPPMAAGLFGYLGYDMVRLVEELPEPNPDPLDLPDAMLLRPSIVAIVDNIRDTVLLCAPAWVRPEMDAEAAWEDAAGRLEQALSALDGAHPDAPVRPLPSGDLVPITPVSNRPREEYLDVISRARDHVRAGEVVQVVPSQRWSVELGTSPFALYRALRRLNPSPYMFYFDMGAFQIVGASPEILVRLRGDIVTIRPIAGTRRRGATPEEDAALEAELLADPKECAEHQMLLDLGLQDIGNVADADTIRATEEFAVERYSHVMHIVSNLEGRLRADQDALSALLAGLPAGTVSGAPRVRAMEIIDALEQEKRGVYAGGVGYFSAGGDMDTCIALRTGVVKDGKLYIQAGGGIVADSDPEAEFEETVNKAKALVAAATMARNFG